MKTTNNKVLSSQKFSANFYESDLILKHYISHQLSPEGQAYMEDKYQEIGEKAAQKMDALSLSADQNEPQLIRRNRYGEEINEIRFHPAYWEMMDMALASEMFYVKWEPSLRKQFIKERHSLGFIAGQIYSMSELGQYCPIAMTDGVARLIDRYGTEEDKVNLLPSIITKDGKALLSGAMYLTEKSGGSDVGKNATSATHLEGDYYLLNGEKWFCSNVNADLTFVLARPDEKIKGTRGLCLFLVENQKPDGSMNYKEIVRLKPKLGVRSMATGEVIFKDTLAKVYGGHNGEGLKMMLDMVALMRIYNSISAISSSRRALVEAYQHLLNRTLFSINGLEHALIRKQFEELCSMYITDFYLTWRTIKALDAADNGNQEDKAKLRFLVPFLKYWTSQNTVYIVRECMELLGGIGYIEDMIMPKLFRDVQVLPIWEGSSNVILLDMLRATHKSPKGLQLIFEDMTHGVSGLPEEHQQAYDTEVKKLLEMADAMRLMDRDEQESTAKAFFNRLLTVYPISLMLELKDNQSQQWINPSINYLIKKITHQTMEAGPTISTQTVHDLMAWHIPDNA